MNKWIKAPEISRRGVLAGFGGMSFCLAFGGEGLRLAPAMAATTEGAKLSPWVRIAPDGTITLLTITEMGQGSSTAIPVILAEEMDADWSKVVLDWAPSEPEIFGWPNPRGG